MGSGSLHQTEAGRAASFQVKISITSYNFAQFARLGIMWQLFNFTGNTTWKSLAEAWTAPIAPQQYNNGTHDVGFMLFYSFGLGYKLTNRSDFKQITLRAAQSLSERFSPIVRSTQSWGAGGPYNYHFPVITGKYIR
jgi:unsaturated chondroitin disaccharide hydrolase